MAKQLNVNLAFTADTSQAKAQIQSLQQTLNNLTTATSLPGATKITSDLVSAKNAAGELKIALQQAINVNTGNLDLTKFNAQLKNGTKDLNYYSQQLAKLGPQGVQAFGQLTQSIMSAEIPLQRTRGLLDEFATTLKNTLRWQVASSALMGISSAVSTAYNYAQDLNASLNDIRIVSGLSADEMDRFAERANKAAKALSTTTTKYTDAALIFYQQGLNDSEVEQRTNATIKMANVTGEAVEDVSSYMTAVWNNFNTDGTQSVEHFGDVMTKLGADTAASTEEIAGGLEKFAAVANTIGLSFEYATSAITTIVDRTRQSEDVVGTALKTIFSRIQGLQQGETQDDGTTLNQYSQALANVGINIKDANGELRDMDEILDDIGNKWDELDRANKVALAQKVAGIRQYTQFMALFDNWDFMEQNLDTAYNADGTLEEQAKIYAESWEAARKRVQAAAEDIYNDLISDDFFIDLANGVEKILEYIDTFIEGMGGLRSVLPLVASLMLKAFGPNISNLMDEMIYRVQVATGALQEEALATQKAVAAEYQRLAQSDIGTIQDQKQAEFMAKRVALQSTILTNSRLLGEQRAKELSNELTILDTLQDQCAALEQQRQKTSQLATEKQDKLFYSAYTKNKDITPDQEKELISKIGGMSTRGENIATANSRIQSAVATYRKETEAGQGNSGALSAASRKFSKELDAIAQEFGNDLSEAINKILKNDAVVGANGKSKRPRSAEQQADELERWDVEKSSTAAMIKDIQDYSNKNKLGLNQKEVAEAAQLALQAGKDKLSVDEAIAQVLQKQDDLTDQIAKELEQAHLTLGTTGETLVKISSGLTSLSFALSSVVGLFQTLTSTDMTSLEKFEAVLTTLPMIVTQGISGYTELKKLYPSLIASSAAYAASLSAEGKAEEKNLVIRATGKVMHLGEIALTKVLNFLKGKKIALTWLEVAANKALESSSKLLLVGIAIITALVAAITLAIKGIKALIQLLHSFTPEGKLEAAKEQAEALNDTLEDTKSRAEEVKNTFDSYNNIVDKLNECTKGTQEWNDAMSEANAAALELLEKYPELASMIDTSGNIVEQLADEGIQNYIQAKSNQQVYQATAANMIGQHNLREAERAAIFSDTNWKSEEVQNAISQAKDQNWEVSDDFYDQFTGTMTKGLINQVKEYVNDAKADMATEKAEISTLASSRVEGLDNYAYAEQVKSILGETYDINEGYDENLEIIKADKEKYAKEYLESLGISGDVTNTSGSGFTYNDGSEEDVEVTWDNVATQMTAAQNDIGEAVARIVNGFNLVADSSLDTSEQDAVIKGINSEGTVDGLSYDQAKEYVKDDGLRSIYLDAYAEAYEVSEIEAAIAYEKVKKNAQAYMKDLDKTLDANNLSEHSRDVAHGLTKSTNENINDMFNRTEKTEDGTKKTWEGDKDAVYDYIGTIGNIEQSALENLDLTKVTNIEEFQEQLRSAATEAGQAFLNEAAETYDLDSEELSGYAEYIQEIAKDSDDLSDNLADSQEAANAYAVSLFRMNKGIETLSENSEEWIDILKKSSKSSVEYYNAMEDMREALGDVLDITDPSQLSANFFDNAENLDLVSKAAEGDADAIEALRDAAYEDILVNVTSNLDSPEMTEEVTSTFNELKTKLDEYDFDIDSEVSIDDESMASYINSLNQMVAAAGMTESQVDAIMDAMGYSATYAESDQPIQQTYPVTKTYHTVENIEPVEGTDDKAKRWVETTYTVQEDVDEFDSNVKAWGLQMNKEGETATVPKIKTITQKASGSANNHSSKNSGGKSGSSGSGGSKSSSASKVDKKTKRYHRVDDELEDVNKKLEKAADLEDRLYGSARIAQMDKKIKAYKEEGKLLDQRLKQEQKYLKQDKKAATKTINKFNKLTGGKVTDVKYDEDGDIINYNTILKQAKAQADKWYKKAKANPEDEAIQERYEKVKEYYDDIKEALDQVEETNDEIVETQEQQAENLRNQQDEFFEKMSYTLEIKLDINDRDIELLEKAYDRIADQTYKRAEAIKYIYSTTGENQISENTKKLNLYTNQERDLKAAYEAGQISQENYVEGLQDVRDGALEAADALQSLDEQMVEYYSDTLADMQEEIDKYTDRIDNLSGSLEHYSKVMELLGKSKNYDQINKINNALTKTAKNQYDISKKSYEAYLSQQKTAKTALDDYVKANKLTTYEQKMADQGYQALLKNYEAITEYVDDAYDTMLGDAEQYFETLNTYYDTFFEQLKTKYLDTLSDTMDFDRLNNSLQNVKTGWEEVLTPVNQAYELTKLTRQAEQDMADTDSAYAKQLYKDYIDSTDALKEKNQVSNLELEIQQAKYKQLQAQIALEEAQNAKNMVRLSRDSEGNYGYVYTADQDSIADAQQAKDDADNELYNIALNGRNTYYEKLLQLESDYQDAVEEARQTYWDDDEALEEALDDIWQEYSNNRKIYLDNYNLAASTSSDAARDAYVNAYEDVIKKTDEWEKDTKATITEITTKQSEYQTATSKMYEELGLDAKNYGTTIDEVAEAADELATQATNTVIPALDAEAKSVLTTTTNYANYRDTVWETIAALDELAKRTNTEITTQRGMDDDEDAVDVSGYNSYVTALAKKKGLYTSDKDTTNNTLHYSKTDQATADKYATNAKTLSTETLNWNNKIGTKLSSKIDTTSKKVQGWTAIDSEGKVHWTSITNEAKAKKYLKENFGATKNFQSYDTGGYTGSWGNSGKLAFLHEKELVLNADDTKNFLAGINILRDVVKSIDLQAMCASNSGMRAAGVSTSNQTLAQEVNITAEFPNATDHSEIEQAFDTLINRAAQYVNRK